MDTILLFLLNFGEQIYAEDALVGALCLVAVLFFTLLSIRNARKTAEQINELRASLKRRPPWWR